MARLQEVKSNQSIYDVVTNYDNVIAMMDQNGISSGSSAGGIVVVIDEELDKVEPIDIKKVANTEFFDQKVYNNQNIYDLIFQSTNNYDNVLVFMDKNSIQKTFLLPRTITFAKSDIKDKFKYQRAVRPATGIIRRSGISVWQITNTFIVGSKV